MPSASDHPPAGGPERVPFVRPDLPDFESLRPHLEAIVASGQLTKGGYLRRFEEAVAAHLGVRHAVAVSSCTVGLLLVHRALAIHAGRCRDGGCEVGALRPIAAGGEVVMPGFTFLAAPAAATWNGLRPRFVEIDEDNTNLTVGLAEGGLGPRTAVLAACHNFGNPCDVAGLAGLARRHGVGLVIDAAHGFGARQGGLPVGRGAAAQVFSLSPTKLLVAGEGGVVATDCDCLARTVRVGREYGNDGSYDAVFPGVNGRMPEMCAATAWVGLEGLERVAAARRAIAAAYRSGLAGLPGLSFVVERPGDASSNKEFSVAVDPDRFGADRDALRAALDAAGIDTRAYYDPPCHRQTAYRAYHDGHAPLPASERLAARSVALPIGRQVDAGVVERVCAVFHALAATGRERRLGAERVS
ncbi:MAG: DegT/DnrJ/EryC1/StrS family aminotransferase [Planctomycetaceae bacterium]